MYIAILGAAGFIGTNLALELLKDEQNRLVLLDESQVYFEDNPVKESDRVNIRTVEFRNLDGIKDVLSGVDMVFHLISTTNPTFSNKNIRDEITTNISETIKILDACVKNTIKRVIFISSGGTVYGEGICPLHETDSTNPITTYGIQKLAIEKLLFLYNYVHGLDYRIARLSNPYGPYQRPNGQLGALTTFTWRAIKGEKISVYGDGSVIRDYIYIDDAIAAINKISFSECMYKLYNIGSGRGISINELIGHVERVLGMQLEVEYSANRSVDLKANYLDITRYEEEFGKIVKVKLEDGIRRTAYFLMERRDEQR